MYIMDPKKIYRVCVDQHTRMADVMGVYIYLGIGVGHKVYVPPIFQKFVCNMPRLAYRADRFACDSA